MQIEISYDNIFEGNDYQVDADVSMVHNSPNNYIITIPNKKLHKNFVLEGKYKLIAEIEGVKIFNPSGSDYMAFTNDIFTLKELTGKD